MLTLQFGQCGNQLGHELFTKISKDIESRNSGQSYEANYEYSEASCERWFSGITKDEKRIARAILVDTEKKVLKNIRQREKLNSQWRYSRKNEIYEANNGTVEGSGNNWSYGYFVKSREFEANIIEAVRRECESADRLDGFLGLLGTAGGTGSGVGSRIMEILRDEYTTKTILLILILPFTSGEVGTQNYNGLLSLAKFMDLADAMILLENDQLLRICANSGGAVHQRGNAEPRFLRDMNEVACEKLLAVFQPIKDVRNGANFFVNKMAPHPGYKMVTIKSTVPLKFSAKHEGSTRTSANLCETGSLMWQIHAKQMRHNLRLASNNFEVKSDIASSKMASLVRSGNSDSAHYPYRRSIANMMITRGCTSKTNDRKVFCGNNDDLALSSELFNDDTLYSRWSSKYQRFTHLHENRRFLEREKFIALVTNNSQIRESLDCMVEKAWNCYTNAAFLHGYKQYGLEDDDFLRAFAKIENVIKLYGELDGMKSY